MDFKYRIIDSEIIITGINDKSVTSIIIPEFIDGYLVTRISTHAFYKNTLLNNIDLPNTIINIGDYAFAYCKSLTNIKIPDSVKHIGEHAFYYCESIKRIILPKYITNINEGVFAYCYSLNNIIIPNTINNINGDDAFWCCTSLDQINNINLKDGINIINNKFIHYHQRIYTIKYKICDDYYCNNNRYYIDNYLSITILNNYFYGF